MDKPFAIGTVWNARYRSTLLQQVLKAIVPYATVTTEIPLIRDSAVNCSPRKTGNCSFQFRVSMAKQAMTIHDITALLYFIVLWTGFSYISGGKGGLIKRVSLNQIMNRNRAEWLRNALRRDLRMIDTQILAGLQNGTGFFASSTIFALGGCFALLGATDRVMMVYQDLPVMLEGGRTAFELKVGGLAGIFGYSFFKFGWSYRLFNYCSIRFGSIPMAEDAEADPERAKKIVEQVIKLNIVAGKNFSAGLRAIFLSIGYLGWFVSPYAFMIATTFIIVVLVRRQFFSDARDALISDGDA